MAIETGRGGTRDVRTGRTGVTATRGGLPSLSQVQTKPKPLLQLVSSISDASRADVAIDQQIADPATSFVAVEETRKPFPLKYILIGGAILVGFLILRR